MKKDMNRVLKSLESYVEKPIGIFGARASGKTIFFTVLYGLSGFNNENQKFSVICSDKDSRQYLKKNYTYLLDGKLPPRTEINDITSINMSYFYNKNSYSLKSFDFAGELLKDDFFEEEQGKEPFVNLQNKIYNFFLNCSGILFFMEPTEDKREGFERQSEIDKLLSFLKEQKGKWDFNIPIGLVITKWDKISPEISEKSLSALKYNGESFAALQDKILQSDIEEEQKKAEDYVKSHPVYNNVYSLLSGVSEHIKIFPVSAFGEARENDLPPNDLKPFNLFSPLIWIAEKRDYEWQKKLRFAISSNMLSLKAVKKIVNDFRQNVENKKLIESVEIEYNIFKKKKVKKAIILASIFTVILFTGGVYSYRYSTEQKNLYEQVVLNKEISNEEKIEKVEKYLKTFGLFHKYIGKYLTKDEYADKLIAEVEHSYNVAIVSELDPDKKIALIDAFIVKYPKSPYVKELQELRDFTQYSKIVSLEKDNLEKYRKWMIFINSHEKYRDKAIILAEANKYKSVSERSKYEEIINCSKDGSNNLDVLFNKIDSYLGVPEFQEYRKEISEMKENLKDDYLFNSVAKSVDSYNLSLEGGFLKDVSRNCESYLSNSAVGRYVPQVKSYLNQISKIDKGISMEVEFYASGELPGRSVDIQAKVKGKSYSLKQKPLTSQPQYLGSLVSGIQINSPIEVKVYLTDSRGDEEEFNAKQLKISDANQLIYLVGQKGSSVAIQMKFNSDNFKLK